VGNLEIVVSTSEAHRQHIRVSNERIRRSQNTSKRSGTHKQNPQVVIQEQNKSLIENMVMEMIMILQKGILKYLTRLRLIVKEKDMQINKKRVRSYLMMMIP